MKLKSRSSKPLFCSVSWWCACMGGGADIVIKSTTACVSSPHSPLICQPRSDDRLRKYMQNIWIRPLHTLSSNFLLFHTLGLLTLSPHTPSRLRVFPFQRRSKTNYINCSAKSFKMITADSSILCFNRISREKPQNKPGTVCERWGKWCEGEEVCMCVMRKVFPCDLCLFPGWDMNLGWCSTEQHSR